MGLTSSVALVRERTIPTERPTFVGEVSDILHNKLRMRKVGLKYIPAVCAPVNPTLYLKIKISGAEGASLCLYVNHPYRC
jgi:hypothetical protein